MVIYEDLRVSEKLFLWYFAPLSIMPELLSPAKASPTFIFEIILLLI